MRHYCSLLQWKDWAVSSRCQQLHRQHQLQLHQTKFDEGTSSKTHHNCNHAHCNICSNMCKPLRGPFALINLADAYVSDNKEANTVYLLALCICRTKYERQKRLLMEQVHSKQHPKTGNIHSSTGDVHLLMTMQHPQGYVKSATAKLQTWSFGFQASIISWYISAQLCLTLLRKTQNGKSYALWPAIAGTVPSRAFVEGHCREGSRSPC